MNQKYIIISGDRYPEGDAGAVRTHMFAKILSSLGFSVLVIGMGSSTDFRRKTYDGVEFCSLRYEKQNIFLRVFARLLFKRHCRKIIEENSLSDIGGIMYVSGGKAVLKYIKRLSRKYSFPLYFDSVEWYSPSEFSMGVLAPAYIKNNRLNSAWIDSSFRVFAISCFLEDYFNQKSIPAMRVPVMMDLAKIQCGKAQADSSESDRLRIIYAGSPGRKDRINEMITAIGMLDREEAARICFRIFGITRESYEKSFGKIQQALCPEAVVFEGRKPRQEVLTQIRNSDFSFLLRPSDERYAKAGFPTKVAESLASGVPLLCNYSSDLSLYLQDGENSIIVEDCTVQACLAALRRILKLRRNEIERMKQNARITAEKYFDWRAYEAEVSKFLSK